MTRPTLFRPRAATTIVPSPATRPSTLADLGFPQWRFEDRVSVRQPTPHEVDLLDLPADVPVFRQFRTIYSDGDRPVEVSILVKGGHLYELLYRASTDAP